MSNLPPIVFVRQILFTAFPFIYSKVNVKLIALEPVSRIVKFVGMFLTFVHLLIDPCYSRVTIIVISMLSRCYHACYHHTLNH